MSLLTKVTSFAALIASANRIHNVIREEQGLTGQEYIGALVEEMTPSGNKLEAIIMQVEWCPSCGLNGNWLIYIAYTDEKKYVPGAWVDRSVLTLKESN